MSKLALLGGTPVMERLKDTDLFAWPIITKEDEENLSMFWKVKLCTFWKVSCRRFLANPEDALAQV